MKKTPDPVRVARVFGIAIATVCVATLALLIASPNRAAHPNVVIFVADDLGWGDVGYHGSEIKTPRIDQLVTEGVELDRFYAFPVCSPTRVALMTGRSPLRFGITGPLSPASPGLPLDEQLMSDAFHAAGYQTWLVGKWHLGAARDESLPNARGFDHSYGCLNGGVDYYKHTEFRAGSPDWHRNGQPLDEAGYTTQLLASEAVRLIRNRDSAKPFLLYLPFTAPHVPLQAPEDTIEKYAAIESANRRTYAAMVDELDTAIGRVLDTLDQQQLTEQTLVLFFSDNGAATRGGGSNGPLAMGKGSVFEGGIRLPATIRISGVLKPGAKVTDVVTILDLFPTLAAAAGIEPQNSKPLDGRNLWPQLRDEKPLPAKPFVVANQRQVCVVDGNWKLVRNRTEDRSEQLYALDKDPDERQDVAGQHPDEVTRLNQAASEMTNLMPSTRGPRGRSPRRQNARRRPGRDRS